MVAAPATELRVFGDDFGHEQVSEVQRARMLAAMVDVVAELGVNGVTVAHVVGRSGVSRRTFYELFEDREDCFLAAFDHGVARIAAEVVAAFEGADRAGRARSWCERVRAALTALLAALDRDPAIGRLVVVESLGGGPMVLERRSRILARVTAVVDEGRGEAKASAGLASLTAEGVVGGVLAVLQARLLAKEPGGLVGLVNELTAMVVLPYLGPAAARRELARPLPHGDEAQSRLSEPDPFRGLHMRFTYRTMRVLMTVAANPGASNRRVGELSGAEDQGQISKLLTRLERVGLIVNAHGLGRGEANAWRLTEKGLQVTQTIRAHAHNNREVAS